MPSHILDLESLFSEVNSNEELQRQTMADLERIWNKVVEQSAVRKEFVHQLDCTLQAVEEERADRVSSRLV